MFDPLSITRSIAKGYETINKLVDCQMRLMTAQTIYAFSGSNLESHHLGYANNCGQDAPYSPPPPTPVTPTNQTNSTTNTNTSTNSSTNSSSNNGTKINQKIPVRPNFNQTTIPKKPAFVEGSALSVSLTAICLASFALL